MKKGLRNTIASMALAGMSFFGGVKYGNKQPSLNKENLPETAESYKTYCEAHKAEYLSYPLASFGCSKTIEDMEYTHMDTDEKQQIDKMARVLGGSNFRGGVDYYKEAEELLRVKKQLFGRLEELARVNKKDLSKYKGLVITERPYGKIVMVFQDLNGCNEGFYFESKTGKLNKTAAWTFVDPKVINVDLAKKTFNMEWVYDSPQGPSSLKSPEISYAPEKVKTATKTLTPAVKKAVAEKRVHN